MKFNKRKRFTVSFPYYYIFVLFHDYYKVVIFYHLGGDTAQVSRMLAGSALDLDLKKSGDNYMWRMRGGWAYVYVCEEGSSKSSEKLSCHGKKSLIGGCEHDSKGDRCKRWGLLLQSCEVWISENVEQRNAVFHLGPSGKTWLFKLCAHLTLKRYHYKAKRT